MRAAAMAAVVTLLLASAPPASAGSERYDSRRAGHPLRIAAYVLHPVGVVLDYLIFYPAWVIGGYEPFRTLTGRHPVLSESEPPASPEMGAGDETDSESAPEP